MAVGRPPPKDAGTNLYRSGCEAADTYSDSSYSASVAAAAAPVHACNSISLPGNHRVIGPSAVSAELSVEK